MLHFQLNLQLQVGLHVVLIITVTYHKNHKDQNMTYYFTYGCSEDGGFIISWCYMEMAGGVDMRIQEAGLEG